MVRKKVHNEKKSDAILNAATHLFLKHGYSDTTMDAIASRAHLTKQTLYSYYRNKDMLFKKMVASLCERHQFAASMLSTEGESFEELLLLAGQDLLELITSADVLAATRLVISESDRHPKLAQLYYESGTMKLAQLMAEFFDRQNARGAVSIPNTLSAASYFLAILKGQYYLHMILRIKPLMPKKQQHAHVRETVKLFMLLYCGSEPLNTESTL